MKADPNRYKTNWVVEATHGEPRPPRATSEPSSISKTSTGLADGVFYAAIIGALLSIVYFSWSGKVFIPLLEATQQIES